MKNIIFGRTFKDYKCLIGQTDEGKSLTDELNDWHEKILLDVRIHSD
jgi:hypothetical protein